MTLKLAYNTTDSAVVDEQGYSVGGRSWGVVDSTDENTGRDYDAGRLIDVPEEAARAADHPDVAVAVAALDDRREKVKKAKAKDKDELIDELPPEVVEALPVGASGEPAKADLVEAFVAQPGADEDGFGGDAPVPAESPATTKKSTSRAAAKK